MEYKGRYQDGVEFNWLDEEEARESFTPLQLDVFHALWELEHGADRRTRPPGVPTRGDREAGSREEALRAYPIGTNVRGGVHRHPWTEKGAHGEAPLQRPVQASEISGRSLGGAESSRDQQGEGVGDSFSLNRFSERRVQLGIGGSLGRGESPRAITGKGVGDLSLNRLFKRRVLLGRVEKLR